MKRIVCMLAVLGLLAAARMASASTRLVRSDSDPPLSMTALPLFSATAAASVVTFGRAS